MESKKIGKEIRVLQSLMTRYIIKHMKDSKNKLLSGIQIDIMMYLSNAKECIYQKDLEKEFNLRKSTISGILQTMEKNKIINKLEAKQDIRSKQILLTEDGNKACQECVEKITKMEKLLLKDINVEELEIFLKVIEQMQRNLSE